MKTVKSCTIRRTPSLPRRQKFAKGASSTYLARYYPTQALSFGSFDAPRFGSFSDDDDVVARQNLTDSDSAGERQAMRTERRNVKLSAKKRKAKRAATIVESSIQNVVPPVTQAPTTSVAAAAPVTNKKTKRAVLLAEKEKLEDELAQMQDENIKLVEAKAAHSEELKAQRAEITANQARIRQADAEVIRLSAEVAHQRGVAEGLRLHAEIHGEPSSAAPESSTVPSRRLRSHASNASTHSSNSGSDSRRRKSAKTSHPVKKPILKQWGGSKDEENVAIFVDRLHRYFASHNVAKDDMPSQALDFLDGKAFQLWKLESEMLVTEGSSLTWDKFESFMKQSFGSIDPERHARQQFDSLKQGSSSVFNYVTEMRRLIRIMHPMPMIRPGDGDIVSRFIANARPELRDYLTANTPEGYWKSTEQLFERAMTWALNNDSKNKNTVPASNAPKLGNMQGKYKHKKAKRNFVSAARGGRPAEAAPEDSHAHKKPKTAPQWTNAQKHKVLQGFCPYGCQDKHHFEACPKYTSSSKRF